MPTSEPMRPPVHVPSTVLAVKSVLSAGIIRSFSFLTKTALLPPKYLLSAVSFPIQKGR